MDQVTLTGFSREAPQVELRIGDAVLRDSSGGRHRHINPATGEVQSEFLLAGRAEMDRAVAESKRAFQEWRTWGPGARRDVLMRFANLVEAHGDEFTRLAVLDNGTPVSQATAGAYFFKAWTAYYAGWADKLDGAVTSTFMQGADVPVPGFPPNRDLSYTLLQPYGVIGAIVTWNGPTINMGMKIGAILAAGNTMVMKPSELTPYCADFLARLAIEAGIPAGVFQVIHGGADAGEALIEHPDVRKISFTGGITAARHVLAACAKAVKPSVLELGGKAAYIVFEDAKLDDAVLHSALVGGGLLAGQSCACAGRLLVHRSIYKEFVDRTVALLDKFPMGDPWDPTTQIGPVITEAAVSRILGMIDRAKAAIGRASTSSRRCSPRSIPAARSRRRRCSAPWSAPFPSTPKSRRSGLPTEPITASPPISTPMTCVARTGSRSRSKPAAFTSTARRSARRTRPMAASSSAASAGRAAARASMNSSSRRRSRSPAKAWSSVCRAYPHRWRRSPPMFRPNWCSTLIFMPIRA
jgi:aldehyde dehydrogenase (NAD+)